MKPTWFDIERIGNVLLVVIVVLFVIVELRLIGTL
jgi:hypothetical protein